jgi:uracil-DNA glycosylase family 4
MNDDAPTTVSPERLARILRQHLASLESAGVEWLPRPTRAPSLSLRFAPAPESPTPADSLADRRRELQVLAEKVSACTRCAGLASTRTQTVFGVGRLDPELCLIGEAPGADEDRQGEPFVGAAGQLLTRILAACGLKREDVYICNILKCRPPNNRTPQADEAAHCSEYLQQQIDLVRPRYICCLGGTAAKYLLDTPKGIGALRGKVLDYRGTPVVCTYHPAYLLPHRSDDPQVLQERKKLVWEDMKCLMAKMGRAIEKKS